MQTGKNDIVIFLLITTAIIFLLASLIVTLIYLYQKKQLAYQKNLNSLQLDHEKNLMAAQLEIQEDTFQHISREIHDNISLSLTLAKLHLNTVDLDNREKTTAQVNTSIELIGQSINDLSNISKSLSSDIISNEGLVTAIQQEINKIKETGLFAIELIITGEPLYLEMQKELVVFRIVQEASNNIIKHAQATKAYFTLDYNINGLNIEIKDNGKGFVVAKNTVSTNTGRAGLKNMKTRINMIGGTVQVDSAVGNGTIISLYLPY